MLIYCGQKKFSLSEIIERPEIAALIADLGLVYTGKRLVLRPRYIPRVTLDDRPLNRLFPSQLQYIEAGFMADELGLSLDSCLPKPSRGLCERLSERNHHRKNFSNVYESNYNYKDLSIDWD